MSHEIRIVYHPTKVYGFIESLDSDLKDLIYEKIGKVLRCGWGALTPIKITQPDFGYELASNLRIREYHYQFTVLLNHGTHPQYKAATFKVRKDASGIDNTDVAFFYFIHLTILD